MRAATEKKGQRLEKFGETWRLNYDLHLAERIMR